MIKKLTLAIFSLLVTAIFAYKMNNFIDAETGDVLPEVQESYNERQPRLFIQLTKVGKFRAMIFTNLLMFSGDDNDLHDHNFQHVNGVLHDGRGRTHGRRMRQEEETKRHRNRRTRTR